MVRPERLASPMRVAAEGEVEEGYIRHAASLATSSKLPKLESMLVHRKETDWCRNGYANYTPPHTLLV